MINKWLIAGAASILLVGVAGAQTWRVSRAHEQIGIQKEQLEFRKAQTEALIAINTEKSEAIESLRQRIVTMVEERELERLERERELERRAIELAEAHQEAERLREDLRHGLAATESCAALATLRVDVACAGVADRLRERSSSRGGEGSSGRGAGRGDPPDSLYVHGTNPLP